MCGASSSIKDYTLGFLNEVPAWAREGSSWNGGCVSQRTDCPKERNRKRTSKIQKGSKRYRKKFGCVCVWWGGHDRKGIETAVIPLGVVGVCRSHFQELSEVRAEPWLLYPRQTLPVTLTSLEANCEFGEDRVISASVGDPHAYSCKKFQWTYNLDFGLSLIPYLGWVDDYASLPKNSVTQHKIRSVFKIYHSLNSCHAFGYHPRAERFVCINPLNSPRETEFIIPILELRNEVPNRSATSHSWYVTDLRCDYFHLVMWCII